MTCNITERFTRMIAGAMLFVLATALNTGWTADVGAGADVNASASARAEFRYDAGASTVASDDPQSDEGVDDADQPAPRSRPEHADSPAASSESNDPAVGLDVEIGAQGTLSATTSADVAETIGATVEDDVRASIQEEVAVELTRSLPLLGQD